MGKLHEYFDVHVAHNAGDRFHTAAPVWPTGLDEPFLKLNPPSRDSFIEVVDQGGARTLCIPVLINGEKYVIPAIPTKDRIPHHADGRP